MIKKILDFLARSGKKSGHETNSQYLVKKAKIILSLLSEEEKAVLMFGQIPYSAHMFFESDEDQEELKSILIRMVESSKTKTD